MKSLITLFVCLLLSLVSIAQDAPQAISHGKLSFHIPAGYYQLSESDIVDKFGMHEIPTALYADPSNSATISVNEKKDTVVKIEPKWNQGFYSQAYDRNLSIEKDFKKSSFQNEFNDLVFIADSAYTTSSGYEIMFFEFTGALEGVNAAGVETTSEVYNIYLYAFKKKRSYVLNMSCPIGAAEQRKALFEIAKTIKL